ncbi:hypothetical protein ACET3Z_015311 [Daucus carota]
MALHTTIFLHLLVMFSYHVNELSAIQNFNPNSFSPVFNDSLSLSFPLTPLTLSPNSTLRSSLISSQQISASSKSYSHGSFHFRSWFKYSMALIVSLPIGTPPQVQQMVIDTGSQLSWIQCRKKNPRKPHHKTSFDPSRSSSYSILPCNHPQCKPAIPDFTLPTSCDRTRHCHYSYFYADGTYAEGNLVREKLSFSRYQSTPPLILGCAMKSRDAEGILGMNLGRFSLPYQIRLSKFSYCVPFRQKLANVMPDGVFYLGQNPYSHTFHYVDILTFARSHLMPNFDPLAYTLKMVGISIGGKKLDIASSTFLPNAGGAGQTMIDSGTEYTFLVDAAYTKVRQEIVRLVGGKIKRGFVYENTLDMCFDGNAVEIGRSIGDLVFQFDKGVEIMIEKERVLENVGGGVHCFGIGRSELLGATSNIIGNFHQQNLWVEFDLRSLKVGFGKADCSRSV